MMLSGADIIVKTLIEQGCDVVFGYPGGQIINVYDSLYKYRDELRHVLTAHEQGAAHAADGYARMTGRPGVVIATSGPGATNLVTGIATAYLDSVPLVAITGNVPSGQLGTDSFQEIDITGITLPITKHNYVVGRVEELADTIREAFRLAMSDRPGPVLVDVPKDIQIAQCEYEPLPPVKADEKKAAKDVRIQEAAECINQAHRPYVYFGGGLINSQAEEEVLALADRIDAPIGCSFMGISGVPTSHPRFLGMQGMHGHYASSMAMHHADCIIALGVRFNDRVTGNREKFATKAQIVHIDIDGAELSKNISPAHALRGDLKLTLQKLLPLLEQKRHDPWRQAISQLKNDENWSLDHREGLTPRNVLLALNRFTKGELPVATDVGQHQMWAAQTLEFRKIRRFVSSGGLGTMGFGMGAAMGAQIATGQRTVLVTGDGGFGMCLNELATAVHENIPLVILIMNNGVLGMVRQWQTLFFDKHYSNTVLDRKTDFVALSKAFGADGRRVTDLNGLDEALKTAFQSDGPYLIECMIDKDEFVLPMLPPGGSMDDIITKVGD
ncbi:biosynthetic-type acetolactate synthase large subunit [Acutalibacter sp. 1XD8-33]|uniref:biosynthetic-type acetolactate synthase large subunit n=1 Tax=Acutalibacter sp. 1XD8-33 TaxID=2320081 RepID=UPI000EA3E3B7|nr:biosynthetic-type acetolactate synthase large subunit [Acutalibacter sp. 1XD8-33]RKJ40063.1 biosynthetic-type acetolactate synthase large subunit [Acutalibacter sp. 1XD8-33]